MMIFKSQQAAVSLTPKQRLIYDFIRSHMETHHMPPSLREIGAHLDLSVGTVQDQVEAIRRKGFLEKEKTKARGLKMPFRMNEVPLLGRVHAGALHASYEEVEGSVTVGQKMASSHHYALRVRGDSMVGAGLLDGDIVIVRHAQTAEEGDIVVARVGDETTVKTLRRSQNEVFLEPANPLYQPIKDTPFEVVGVVVELRRSIQKRRP